MREYVLRLPHRFRYRLAYDHARSIAVFGLFVRAVMGLGTVRERVLRHLRRHGWLAEAADDVDPVAEREPVLEACYAGSIARVQTLGPHPGAPVTRVGADRDKRWVERRLEKRGPS